MTWTLAQAKDHLSEVVRRAVDHGPQTISVRGRDTAVVLSKADYDALAPTAPSFVEHLLGFPKVGQPTIERDPCSPRDVEL